MGLRQPASPFLLFLLLLALLAFGVRAGAVVALRDPGQPPSGAYAGADDVQFYGLAARMAEGRGYVGADGRPTAFRAPGYSLLLAALFAVFGPSPRLGYLLNCALGAASCLLTYACARELLEERWARWAGVLAALYLGHVYFATRFFSENLFVPALGLAMWLLLRYLRDGGRGHGLGTVALAGLMLGVAALTRPFTLLLLGLLPPLLLVAGRRARRPAALPAAVLSVALLAVVLPWTLRNYQVFHRVVLVASNGGSTFYGGNNGRVASELRLLGYWVSTTELPHRDLVDAQPDEISHDKMEWRLGFQWVRDHPGRSAALLGLKLARMWWLPEFDAGRGAYALRLACHLPVLLLLALGAVALARDRSLWAPRWWVVHVNMIATLLTVLIFWGSARFRDAVLPCLAVYAALGLRLAMARRAAPPTSS